MTDYFYVENNQIVAGPKRLPSNWRTATRNISGLDRASPEYLKELGWFPVVEYQNGFDGAVHTHMGWSYTLGADSVTATRQYIVTPEPPAPPPVRIISPRALRERMTEAEQSAINLASMTDAQVFDWRLRAAEAQEIDLDHPETVIGLTFLVSKSLLTAARATELLQ